MSFRDLAAVEAARMPAPLRILFGATLIAVAAVACHRVAPAPSPAAPAAGMVPVGDARIHYEIHGDGPPLVLLHGGLGHAGYWEKQVPALSRHYEVILIDSRGHGRSTYAERPITYALMAMDVVTVMDALEVERAHVLGWSDGANTGLDLAINHPERLHKLIAFGGNSDPSGIRDDFVEHAVVEQYIERTAADYQRLSPNPDAWEAFLENIQRMWATEPHFTSEQLGAISVPTLILAGAGEEAIYPDHTRQMAALIPTATLTFVDDTGHFAHWEKPDEFNAIVLRFLED